MLFKNLALALALSVVCVQLSYCPKRSAEEMGEVGAEQTNLGGQAATKSILKATTAYPIDGESEEPAAPPPEKRSRRPESAPSEGAIPFRVHFGKTQDAECEPSKAVHKYPEGSCTFTQTMFGSIHSPKCEWCKTLEENQSSRQSPDYVRYIANSGYIPILNCAFNKLKGLGKLQDRTIELERQGYMDLIRFFEIVIIDLCNCANPDPEGKPDIACAGCQTELTCKIFKNLSGGIVCLDGHGSERGIVSVAGLAMAQMPPGTTHLGLKMSEWPEDFPIRHVKFNLETKKFEWDNVLDGRIFGSTQTCNIDRFITMISEFIDTFVKQHTPKPKQPLKKIHSMWLLPGKGTPTTS